MKPDPVVFLELNEVNFEFVSNYAERGLLPNFKRLLDENGYTQTDSELNHDELEPWIQWVTAHSGLTFKEHGIFRLGDIIKSDIEQIWEKVSSLGESVGAISPMNAKFRSARWDFFIPDPWTNTEIVASPLVGRMYQAIVQAVNDNAQAKLTRKSKINLLLGVFATVPPKNYYYYFKLVAMARSRPWMKAIFLDRLLADLYMGLVKSKKTRFSTLFLNAAAHVQHHYLFLSSAYGGAMKNPDWYVRSGCDPVLDAYKAYDRILGDIRLTLGGYRIMLATGLHQDPHPEITYYWRLKDHRSFLDKIGIKFTAIEPRMSRDFQVIFSGAIEAKIAEDILNSVVADDGRRLFEVDNRGNDLFVMLCYPADVNGLSGYRVGNNHFTRLIEDVAFVAIKNGEHNSVGYFADTGTRLDPVKDRFPLSNTPNRVLETFSAN